LPRFARAHQQERGCKRMRFWILFLITLTAAVLATAQLPEQSDVLVPVGHWLVQQGDNPRGVARAE